MTVTNRLQPRLQITQARDNGRKYSSNLLVSYVTGQSDAPTYRVRISNHLNYPENSYYPDSTGKITFTITESGWTTTRIQAKEIYNANPLSLSPFDTTLDVAYIDLNGFTLESIPAGAYRDVLIKMNGTGLTFADLLLQVGVKYPS